MNTHLISTRCATAAIAAVLALGSTGLIAQAAVPEPGAVPGPTTVQSPPPVVMQPAPVTVPVQSAPAPQPTIVAPGADILSGVAPTTSAPSQAQAPVAAAPVTPDTPTATQTRRTAAAPAPTTRSPTAATSMAASAPPAEEAITTDRTATEPFAPEVEPVFVPPVALDSADAPEADATAIRGPDLLDLAGYTIAALLFIALIAFIFRTSRKPKRYAAKPAQARPIERREPLPAAPPVQTAVPQAPLVPPVDSTAFAAQQSTVAPMATYRRDPVAGRGGAVPLPRHVPESFAERDALVKRMVAASPDRANPFRSYKARAHRAKLILQSIGHHFTDRDPWIDLSAYPDIWPEVANRRFPHAA